MLLEVADTEIFPPATIHRYESIPGSSQNGHDNVNSPPPSNATHYADASDGCQESIKLLKNKEEGYSENEVTQATYEEG